MKVSVFYVLLVFFGFMGCKETVDPRISIISAEEMQTFLKFDDVQLVDVRSNESFKKESIPLAQNIDYASPTFLEDIERLDKAKPVFVYCNTGKRSAKCSKKLLEAGFTKIYDLEGGITKWKHEGYETNKND